MGSAQQVVKLVGQAPHARVGVDVAWLIAARLPSGQFHRRECRLDAQGRQRPAQRMKRR